MIGPTFVISSYSRSRRRHARRTMSSALDPEFLPDEFLELHGSRPRLIEVREARLRKIIFPAAFSVEQGRHSPEQFRGVDQGGIQHRYDELHVVRRLRQV